MSKQKIPVFVCSDENYAPFVAITALSICLNTSEQIDLYVIDCGIKDETKNKVEQVTRICNNLDVHWLALSLEEYFSDFIALGHISKAAYGRFLIPLLNTDLKKVIYSDIDVIYCGDISELYRQDLKGMALGAVPGLDRKSTSKVAASLKRLGLSQNHIYFESGLLLIDSDQWRTKGITNKLFETEKQIRDRLLYVDQDILNYYFECNYCPLNEKFSVTSPRAKKFIDWRGRLENCTMRHFEGPRKPWLVHPLWPERFKSNNIGRNLFWHYARMTPFYQELIQRFPIYAKLVGWGIFK